MDYWYTMNVRENWGKRGIVAQIQVKEEEHPHSVGGEQAKSLGPGRWRLTPRPPSR